MDPVTTSPEDPTLLQAMERLLEVVQQLSMARSLAQVMAIVRTAARELTGADGASFVLRDGDKCYYADEDAIAPLWKGLRFPMEACVSGWAMREKASAVIPDIYADPRVPVEAYEPTFVRSMVMVPIRRLDPIGAIGTYWATKREAPAYQVRLLQSLADSTSIALENVSILQDLEQHIQARTRELEAANVSLAAFNAAVSHDLRNPLMSVVGFAQLIEDFDGKNLSPRSQEWLTKLGNAAHRMNDLIDDLLRLSAASDMAIAPEPVDLSAMAEGVIDALRLAEPQREVEVRIEPGLTTVADPGLMRIVMTNLLGNAWKYSAKAATPRVEVGRAVTPEGGAFYVRDNGIGFDPAHGERLFLPFSRLSTDRDFQGTGIGLVTVKRVIARHGGRLWAEGVPGQGATFYFDVP